MLTSIVWYSIKYVLYLHGKQMKLDSQNDLNIFILYYKVILHILYTFILILYYNGWFGFLFIKYISIVLLTQKIIFQ